MCVYIYIDSSVLDQQIKLASLTTGETLLDYDSGTHQYLITCVASDGYLTSEVTCLLVSLIHSL